MTSLELFLAEKGVYMLTFILMGLGIVGMIYCSNYLKKIVCMNVMQIAIIFFFLILGQKTGGTVPVIIGEAAEASTYINPIPHTLMLTAIVVGLGTTGVALALLMKIKNLYGTIEDDEITERRREDSKNVTK